MKQQFYMISIMILSITIGALLVLLTQNLYPKIKENKYSSINDKEFNCSNLSFEDSVTCMNAYIKSMYNYTIRDENRYNSTDGNLEDIKMNGGDCYDWSNLYVTLAQNVGLEGIPVSFFPENKTIGHRIAIIYNQKMNEYCVLDQRHIVGCQMLEVSNATG